MKKLAVIGLAGQSAFLQVSRFPVPGETIQSRSLMFEIGGKGYNQAVAATRMGVQTVFIGAVGADANGKLCKQMLAQEGVEGIFFEKDIPTAFATITINQEGENIVQVFPGAARQLSGEDFMHDSVKDSFQSCGCLLLQNELTKECLVSAIDLAKERQIPTILNPAPFDEDVKAVLPFCDLITPNYGEAKALAGFALTDVPSDQNLADGIRNLGVKNAVITDGENGVIIIEEQDVQRFPAFCFGKAVDTTGAGDVFNGTLAASIVRGETLRESVKLAIVAAGISVTRKGAVAGIPRENEVLRMRKEYEMDL